MFIVFPRQRPIKFPNLVTAPPPHSELSINKLRNRIPETEVIGTGITAIACSYSFKGLVTPGYLSYLYHERHVHAPLFLQLSKSKLIEMASITPNHSFKVALVQMKPKVRDNIRFGYITW